MASSLSARLWLPAGARAPAVLECIPYRKRDLYRPYDDIWGEQLARNGIAFVRLDVRGSGDSEGVITDEYSEAELHDCIEAIAWIARQDWCTGAVGMRGISWGRHQHAAGCSPSPAGAESDHADGLMRPALQRRRPLCRRQPWPHQLPVGRPLQEGHG